MQICDYLSTYGVETALPHDDLIKERTNWPDVHLVIVVLYKDNKNVTQL